MVTLKQETIDLIKAEMESIPVKYQQPFNSTHEGLAVLREEYLELENEIFWGEKKIQEEYDIADNLYDLIHMEAEHKSRIRAEAVQVAAMAARIIQELT